MGKQNTRPDTPPESNGTGRHNSRKGRWTRHGLVRWRLSEELQLRDGGIPVWVGGMQPCLGAVRVGRRGLFVLLTPNHLAQIQIQRSLTAHSFRFGLVAVLSVFRASCRSISA